MGMPRQNPHLVPLFLIQPLVRKYEYIGINSYQPHKMFQPMPKKKSTVPLGKPAQSMSSIINKKPGSLNIAH